MMPGVDLANVLLSLIGGLLIIVWWSIRSWMCKVDNKLDQVITKQAQQDKDCVTWEEFNKLKSEVVYHSTEIAVIKTTCENERGK